MKIFITFCISIFILLTLGCAPEMIDSRCSHSLEKIASAVEFKAIFNEMAAELCIDDCKIKGSQRCLEHTLLITDFVDLQTYSPGKTGILLGELMRGSINTTCGHKLIQAEFSKHFKLSDKGLVALTRNPDEIKSTEYPYSESIIGTYNYSNNKLFFFVRRINVFTGKISKFTTREISYSCDLTGPNVQVK